MSLSLTSFITLPPSKGPEFQVRGYLHLHKHKQFGILMDVSFYLETCKLIGNQTDTKKHTLRLQQDLNVTIVWR